MSDLELEKVKRNLRNMSVRQRIDLMDWLKSWYAFERYAYEQKCLGEEE